jgi:hypothetical protein
MDKNCTRPNVKINEEEFWGRRAGVISGWGGVEKRPYMGVQSSHRIGGL